MAFGHRRVGSYVTSTTRQVTRGHQQLGEQHEVKHLLLLACLALAYTSAADAASTLRCNGRIIRVGVPAAFVLSQCGEPGNTVIQEAVARSATVGGSSRIVGIALSEQWVYDRG